MRQLMRDLEQVHAPHLAIDIRRMNFIGYIHPRLLSYSAIPYEEASVWTFINILHHLESCLVLPCVPTPIVQALPMVYLDDIKELIRISYCFSMLLCSYNLSLNSASALLNTNLVQSTLFSKAVQNDVKMNLQTLSYGNKCPLTQFYFRQLSVTLKCSLFSDIVMCFFF